MKYRLNLNYTEKELRELKALERHYDSPMVAIHQIVDTEDCDDTVIKLWEKFDAIDYKDEFKFMADINNVVMGTAIFPQKKYVVYDSATDQYIYYSALQDNLRWGYLKSCAEKKTKEEWLAINPAYEPMLKVFD